MCETNIKYELVDAETGNVFEVMVSRREASLLDYDKDRRFRLLNSLKEKNAAPAFHWDVSYVVPSGQIESPSTAGSGHSSQPLATSSPIIRPPRATGKTGGVWKDDSKTKAFLQECIKRKTQMQARTVDETVYQSISDALYTLNIDYSSGQLRAKMKTLRRQHVEAKSKGQHGGSNWKFFNLMEMLFPRDSPQLVIDDDCAKGLEHFDSMQVVTGVSDEEAVNGSEESIHLHLSASVCSRRSAADETAWLHSQDRTFVGASGNERVLPLSQDVQKGEILGIEEFQEPSEIQDSTTGNSPWRTHVDTAKGLQETNIPMHISNLSFSLEKSVQINASDTADRSATSHERTFDQDSVQILAIRKIPMNFIKSESCLENGEEGEERDTCSFGGEAVHSQDAETNGQMSDTLDWILAPVHGAAAVPNQRIPEVDFDDETLAVPILDQTVDTDQGNRNVLPKPQVVPLIEKRAVVAPDANNNVASNSAPIKKKNQVVPDRNGKLNPVLDSPLNSPSSKQAKQNNGSRSSQKSPRGPRTPKRRLATNEELIWPPALVEAFLRECLKVKEGMQHTEIATDTWKIIAAALQQAGHDRVTWQTCRGKYASMLTFFTGTLLRTGGVLGGVKCPYWDLMCELHDFPTDYIKPEEQEYRNCKWTREAILLLISGYKLRMPVFNGTKSHVRHSTLYLEIAQSMSHFNFTFNGTQCKDKFNDLKSEFFKEFDGQGGTGQGPSTFEYYNEMEDIFKGTATLHPPFLYSSGSSKYSIREGEATSSTGTRTRVASQHEPKKESHGPKNGGRNKATFKSKQTEIQERRLEQTDTFVEEFRLMRQVFSQQVQVLQQLAGKNN